jgi:hypothetical protein
LITAPLMKIVCQSAPKAFLSVPKLFPAHAAARLAFENCRNGRKQIV